MGVGTPPWPAGIEAGEVAPVQREIGFVDPPRSELGRHQGDGLGSAIGEEKVPRGDTHGGGQCGRGGLGVGVATDGSEVGGDGRRRVGGDRIEAGREVQDLLREQAKGPGQASAVAAMGAGGDHRGSFGRRSRPRARRPARPTPASTAESTNVTSRDSAMARAMSAVSGGRPAPRGARSSLRPVAA